MSILGKRCASCGYEVRLKHREFSAHAWAMLVRWSEIERSAIGKPMCDSCYEDLRMILIERADELEAVLAEGNPEAFALPASHDMESSSEY
jgi:hypothetical protein